MNQFLKIAVSQLTPGFCTNWHFPILFYCAAGNFFVKMRYMQRRLISAVVCTFAFACVFPLLAHDPVEEMAEAADHFLAALTPDQKAKATFELKSDERVNWHFIPKPRKGLPIKEMNSAQRSLALGLLNSGLSHRGYLKASTIMSLEEILKDMEQGKGPTRDPELYFFSIFGTPDPKGTWGWRVEGHHLSVNFTIADGKAVAVTPSFLGTNPAEVRSGPRKGLRVLGTEEDLARKLVLSLNDDQKKIALYTNTAPSDIITGADRKAHVLDPKGITMKQLNEDQQKMLKAVINEYIHRARKEFADKELKKIKAADSEKIYFAWAGSTERGQPHYYRVQGPSFLLEYDNTQNNANHVHAVWRDLENDFGDDILRKHYDESHSKK
jgi:hypothetical protein